jgi:hypothetical protein
MGSAKPWAGRTMSVARARARGVTRMSFESFDVRPRFFPAAYSGFTA